MAAATRSTIRLGTPMDDDCAALIAANFFARGGVSALAGLRGGLDADGELYEAADLHALVDGGGQLGLGEWHGDSFSMVVAQRGATGPTFSRATLRSLALATQRELVLPRDTFTTAQA